MKCKKVRYACALQICEIRTSLSFSDTKMLHSSIVSRFFQKWDFFIQKPPVAIETPGSKRGGGNILKGVSIAKRRNKIQHSGIWTNDLRSSSRMHVTSILGSFVIYVFRVPLMTFNVRYFAIALHLVLDNTILWVFRKI